VLLVAGALGKSGAAVLSGRMALRAGAGLVTIATPVVVLPVVAGAQPEYMTVPLQATRAGTVALKMCRASGGRKLRAGKVYWRLGRDWELKRKHSNAFERW